jgi:outer membrane protein assembly factor BamA
MFALGTVLLMRLAEPRSLEPPPVIGSIEVVVQDVFEDAGVTPDVWAYRLANRLHVETRESVVRQELLFREGDRLDPEALAQTERNLRALPFLREARVEAFPLPPRAESERVRVRVLVSDSWSTTPEARLAKVGNRWVWGLGLTEGNLLGRGKLLQALYSSDLDRDQTFAVYRDPRLLGSRVALQSLFSAASDGHHVSVWAFRPFYSLGTNWSFQMGGEDFDRLDPLYENGERVDQLRHTRELVRFEVARSVRRTTTNAQRLHVGYEWARDDVETQLRQFGLVRFGFTSVAHAFRKLTHVNRFERTEDVNLGNETTAFLGILSPYLGGEEGVAYLFQLGERIGLPLNETGFLVGNVSWQARQHDSGIENSVARARLDLVQKLSLHRVLLAKADFQYGAELDPEVQLRLGAESGLRGYPVRQFNGTRSLLLSVEGRWFLWDEVASLVSVGVAAFFDSGFAWPDGQPVSIGDLRSDVGMSVLLGANRVSASRPGVRFDLAYALDPIEGRGRWLFSAGSQLGF